MKTLRIFASVIAAAIFLGLAVCAAPIDFVPSIEQNGVTLEVTEILEDGSSVVGLVRDTNDNIIDKVTDGEMIITVLNQDVIQNEVIYDNLTTAKEQLRTSSIETLLPDFATIWSDVTGGAPVENAVVSHIFDVYTTYEISESETITFMLANPGIALDTSILVLHNYEANLWEAVDFTRDEAGNIIVTVDSLSPFAIIVDNGAAPSTGTDAPHSPQTGVVDVLPVVGCAIILAAGCTMIGIYKVGKAKEK